MKTWIKKHFALTDKGAGDMFNKNLFYLINYFFIFIMCCKFFASNVITFIS